MVRLPLELSGFKSVQSSRMWEGWALLSKVHFVVVQQGGSFDFTLWLGGGEMKGREFSFLGAGPDASPIGRICFRRSAIPASCLCFSSGWLVQ